MCPILPDGLRPNVLMVHKYSGGFLLKMTWPNGISESLRD